MLDMGKTCSEEHGIESKKIEVLHIFVGEMQALKMKKKLCVYRLLNGMSV